MNSFAGDMRCITLFVTGQISAQWTPSAGLNWQNVDEVAMDGDTTYNSSGTPGTEDILNLQALLRTVDQVIAVQLTGVYRKDTSGTAMVSQLLQSGGVKSYGTAFSVPNGWSYFIDIWKMDPNGGGNWSASAANNLAAGYNLVSN